jgi:hypothetical protein
MGQFSVEKPVLPGSGLSGNQQLYILFLSVFWILLRIAQTRSRDLFLLGFVPPIAWLVFAKTTGLLFFVGLSYMLFRCAHVEWELSKRKINMNVVSRLHGPLFLCTYVPYRADFSLQLF